MRGHIAHRCVGVPCADPGGSPGEEDRGRDLGPPTDGSVDRGARAPSAPAVCRLLLKLHGPPREALLLRLQERFGPPAVSVEVPRESDGPHSVSKTRCALCRSKPGRALSANGMRPAYASLEDRSRALGELKGSVLRDVFRMAQRGRGVEVVDHMPACITKRRGRDLDASSQQSPGNPHRNGSPSEHSHILTTGSWTNGKSHRRVGHAKK
jgi:hypothetical protein